MSFNDVTNPGFISPLALRTSAFRTLRVLNHTPGCVVRRLRTRRPHRVIITASTQREKKEDDSETMAQFLPVQISRRQAIQLLNAVLGVATVTLMYKMREQFRLLSPRTVLASFGLSRLPFRSAVPPAFATIDPSAAQLDDAIDFLKRVDAHSPVQCPDFPKGADWINTRPLSFRSSLSGKLVLLDFFTYCCINCQHVLPKLADIEKKYGHDGSGGLVVVGVHSAKFTAERDTGNVAAAVERYGVRHPVINDATMRLWNEIGVSSWPTLALVSPAGNLIAVWTGERQETDIEVLIAASLKHYADIVDHRPLPAAPERSQTLAKVAASPLRYPGKVAISGDGLSLFVSDSANNRVLQLDGSTGKALRIFGSGQEGLADGPAEKAKFHSPQGISLHSGILYVADTESHAIRAIDTKSGEVATIGGTGVQGFDYYGGQIGVKQTLSSPWDVEVYDGHLYVAMAGTHQIWRFMLPPEGKGKWDVFSGSGRELEKNSTSGRSAAWAQPSHLSASSNGMLFVADSESSSLRAIDVHAMGNPTRTIAGGDGLLAENLFAFGDEEGQGSRAKFQHPLAVCYDSSGDRVFVADSYNHRIKVVDNSGTVRYFCGKGKPGFVDGGATDAMFWEPSGLALSADGSKLYVADTNNFAIRVVDTETRKTTTLPVSSLEAVQAAPEVQAMIRNRRRAVTIPCDAISSTGVLDVAIKLPERSHFTPGTVSRYQVNLRRGGSTGALEVISSGKVDTSSTGASFKIDLSKAGVMGPDDEVEAEALTYYCTEVDDVCRMEASVFKVSISIDGPTKSSLQHSITAPRAAVSGGLA